MYRTDPSVAPQRRHTVSDRLWETWERRLTAAKARGDRAAELIILGNLRAIARSIEAVTR